MNLSKRVSLLVSGFVFLVSLSIGMVALFFAADIVQDTAKSSLRNQAELGADLIQTMFRSYVLMLQELAANPNVQTMDWEIQRKTLIAEAARMDFLEFGVVSFDGTVRYAIDGSSSNLGDRDYVKEALSGQLAVSDVLISRHINKPVVMCAVPILSGGKVSGALIARQSAYLLSDATKRVKLGTTGYSYMVNQAGTFIAHQNQDLVLQQVNAIAQAKTDPSYESLAMSIETALKEHSGITQYRYNDKDMFVGYMPMKEFNWILMVAITYDELMAGVNKLRFIIFVLIGTAVLVGAVLSVLLGHSVAKPVIKMIPTLKAVAGGNLTERLCVNSQDEIGIMSEQFNASIGSLSEMVANSKCSVGNLEGVANKLQTTVQETSSVITHITGNISDAKQQMINQSTSVTQTNATIEQIKANSERLNASIERQSAQVVRSSAAVEQMVGNITLVAEILRKNTAAMDALLNASETGKEGIEEVVNIMKQLEEASNGLIEASAIIQNIAAQTNLLAMNAAIEAAHAGEMGKGFAVVADEIRKLAENSSTQGKSISKVLNDLKEQINSATALSGESQERFSKILNLLDEVRKQETSIKDAMDQQTTGSSNILEAMREINAITLEVKGGSSEMMSASSNVLSGMTNLTKETEHLNAEMDEISDDTRQISQAVENLNAITVQTRASINSLSHEVAKFKVANSAQI
ncbi:MAG: methyl-accepting chemotaxis protein [Spirochaetales bacterium]|jgi:methyl-accepting chemotaxis protein|nr:methyl-accepting chemotaxis protein [Spirochaetales bacterium]